ncbi:MAG: DUF3284 domain-containing protein [Culicoidibacterales bacterium]
MSRTFTYEHTLNYAAEDIYTTIYQLTIEQMESIGKAIKTPSAVVGTQYEYEMMLKKQKTKAIFTIKEYEKDAVFAYEIIAGRLENGTTWTLEKVTDSQTKITYVETSNSDLMSADLTYRFLGWMMKRKQKKQAQQLIKVIEIRLYEAAQKKA